MKTLIKTLTALFLLIAICLLCSCGKVNFAKKYASIAGESWCTIASDGSYMKIDTNPYDIKNSQNQAANSQIKVVLQDLGFSGSIYEEMKNTSALMGRQSASTDKYSVSWTYHPDRGLEVLFSKQ